MIGYLDASVMIPILVKEPASAAVDAFMLAVQHKPWVSDFASAEVASAVSRLVRTGRLQASDGAACLSDFDVWRVAMTQPAETHAADVRLAGVFVRRFDLAMRVPDALHLAIARRLDATLITLDRRLATACRELGIAVEVPKTT